MHILHTVLCTYLTVLTKRICLTIKNFSGWWSFPVFLWPYCVIEGRFHRENLVASLYSRDCNYGSKCFTVITSATIIVNIITLPVHFLTSPKVYHPFIIISTLGMWCWSTNSLFHIRSFSFYSSRGSQCTLVMQNHLFFFSLTKEIFTIKCTNTVRFLCQLGTDTM